MADTKISALAALLGDQMADLDEFVLVDKSDVTMAASGTDKRITFAELVKGLTARDLGVDYWGGVGGLFP